MQAILPLLTATVVLFQILNFCFWGFGVLSQNNLALDVLNLQQYLPLMNTLAFPERRQISLSLLQSVLKAKAKITSADQCQALMQILTPLVRDVDGTPSEDEDDAELFTMEQRLMGKLVHLIHSDNTDEQFQVQPMRLHSAPLAVHHITCCCIVLFLL